MKPPGVQPIPVRIEELEGLLEQARPALSAEGYEKLRAAIRTLVYVTELLDQKETTLAALRELLCPASTEKTDQVLQQAGIRTGEQMPGSESTSQKPKRAAGHGRNGAAAYHGAQKVPVPHASFKDRRRVSGWVWRQGLSAARSRRAGTDQRAGAPGRDRL
jgi:hypothetical protein